MRQERDRLLRCSRRDFLRLSGYAAAGAALDPLADKPTDQAEWLIEQTAAAREKIIGLQEEFAKRSEALSARQLPRLHNDFDFVGLPFEKPRDQEPPPLTPEQKQEALDLHRRLYDYWQEHPEIQEQTNRIQNKLNSLGFESDPTPTRVLLRAELISHFSRFAPEEADILFDIIAQLGLDEFRILCGELTGEKKARFLEEAKEPKYWQPASQDEEVVLAMSRQTITELLRDRAGNIVTSVTFVPLEEITGEKKDTDGQASSTGKLEFFLADNFLEIDDICSESLGEATGQLQEILAELEEKKDLWSSANQDEEINRLLLGYRDYAVEEFNYMETALKFGAEGKAGDISLVLRHEAFGHLLDPLLRGYDIYSLEDQLLTLELVTDYLLNHRELVDLPADYQGSRDPTYLWSEVLDICHSAWADPLTYATDHDWLVEEEVTDEQKQLIEKILERVKLNLSINRIKEVYHEAFLEATQVLIENYHRQPEYQQITELSRQVEAQINGFLSGVEATAAPGEETPPAKPSICPNSLAAIMLVFAAALKVRTRKPKNVMPASWSLLMSDPAPIFL